jgi:molybdopterin-guanine dinucleotide biosynthesis protein A
MASAAILAGGRATRFGGRDKSALIVGGRTILERQLAELARLTDDLLIVTSHDSAPTPTPTIRLKPDPTGTPLRLKPDPTEITCGVRLEADLAPVGTPAVRLISDRVADSGPLGGLDAALTAARDDVLVLIACDMPFVTAELLRHLIALTRDADAVVPWTERGYHPLCAAYTRACRPAIGARLQERRLAMTGLFEDIRMRAVTTGELDAFGEHRRLLANVNTPADYEEIGALFGHEL